MHRHEIAFAKQGALATRDWDTYQTIIRTCLTDRRTPLPPGLMPTSPSPSTHPSAGAAAQLKART